MCGICSEIIWQGEGRRHGYRRNKTGHMLITVEASDGHVGVHHTILSTFVSFCSLELNQKLQGFLDLGEGIKI